MAKRQRHSSELLQASDITSPVEDHPSTPGHHPHKYLRTSAMSSCHASNMTSSSPIPTNTIDEDLYSRQIGAYGIETMGKLIQMRILIIGISGVSAEVSKNIALAGPRSITICDPDSKVVTVRDLGQNFFLRSENVGMKQIDVILPRLTELNDYVTIRSTEASALNKETIASEYDVVVCCNQSEPDAIKYNNYCRDAAAIKDSSVPFISVNARGLSCSVFTDFGMGHTILDKDGENEFIGFVNGVVREDGKLVICLLDDKLNEFQAGQYVSFSEVQGMTSLNDHGPYLISSTNRKSFTIEAPLVEQGEVYTTGGITREVKLPKKVDYKTLEESLRQPLSERGWNYADYSVMDHPPLIHLAYQAIEKFKKGCTSVVSTKQHVIDIIAIAHQLMEEYKGDTWLPDKIDERVIHLTSIYYDLEIPPISALIGGMAAQEVVKKTGKFTPIDQYIYIDYFHMVSEELDKLTSEIDFKNSDSRYFDMTAIFGKAMFQSMREAKLFLVGAGALGCEFLKLFALMGISSITDKGKLTVTDMDTIENSNLNRQFLFRKHHIGKMKSDIAASAAHSMNPDFRIASTQQRVGRETEDFFDDKFWEGLHVVVNALDNVESRLYVDSKCVWYSKPLLESGTLGTWCNSQSVIPHLTQSYGESRDPPEKSIPLCTLKNFPYLIEHCLQWSRDTFQGIFSDVPEDVRMAMANAGEFETKVRSVGFVKTQVDRVKATIDLINLTINPNLKAVVEHAAHSLMVMHNHTINQLLYNFPAGHMTEEGTSFWSGTKRLPSPADLTTPNDNVKGFIISATRIYLNIIGFKDRDNIEDDDILDILKGVTVIEFSPDTNLKIVVDEDAKEDTSAGDVEPTSDDATKLTEIFAELKRAIDLVSSSAKVEPEVFEKDDDTNHHIDFVHACGNLRAFNYSIDSCPRHESKMIAGKIIPALATTTSMVTGMIAMELIKTFNSSRPIEEYRNCYANLAVNLAVFSEPLPTTKNKDTEFDEIYNGPLVVRPAGFTIWDKITIVKKDCTVQDILTQLEKDYNVETTVISSAEKILYMSYMPQQKNRLNRTICDIMVELFGETIKNKATLSLEVGTVDLESGVDVMLPQIVLKSLD